MDSPGYCATYLTYVMMEYNSKKIVDIQIVDCRETDLKSGNMEKLGFIRATDALAASCEICEIIADAHPQLKALLSEYGELVVLKTATETATELLPHISKIIFHVPLKLYKKSHSIFSNSIVVSISKEVHILKA